MSKLVIGFLLVLSSFLASANPSVDSNDPYYEISDVVVEVVESSDENVQNNKPFVLKNSPGPGSEVGDVISVLREIIAFGKEIYKIVEAGKPVINTNYAPISVLPLETEFGKDITPMKLSKWRAPKFVKFKVTYKNGYGAEVVSFTYNVNMSYGGQFKGKGAFITNAQIVPENVTVAWGYTFNAKMSLVGLTNIGTDEEPIAGATLVLSYSVSTLIKEDRNNMTIFIAGDGTIQQM
jgi:hypothetical protein